MDSVAPVASEPMPPPPPTAGSRESPSATTSPASTAAERQSSGYQFARHRAMLAPSHSPLSKTPRRRIELSTAVASEEGNSENVNDGQRRSPAGGKHADVAAGQRLYQHAAKSRAAKEKALRKVAIDLREKTLFKATPKTSELASSFWLKRLKEIASAKAEARGEQFSDTKITLAALVESLGAMGLPVKTSLPVHLLVRECGESAAPHSPKETTVLRFSRVEDLIKAALDAISSNFSPKLVRSIKRLFACPVRKPEPIEPKPEPPKIISAREFFQRLQDIERLQKQRRALLIKEIEAEEAKTLTFRPELTAKNRSSIKPSNVRVHVRLFNEAEQRKRKLETSVLEKTKKEEEESMLECSFHPCLNRSKASFQSSFLAPTSGLNESSFVSVAHLWEEDYIQLHLERMERARLEKQEKNERMEYLARTGFVKNAPSALSPIRSGTRSATKSKAQLEVILRDGSTLIIDLKRSTDPVGLANDLAIKCQLTDEEREYIETGVDDILREVFPNRPSDATSTIEQPNFDDSALEATGNEEVPTSPQKNVE